MKFIDESILEMVGFNDTSPEDYLSKAVTLRDGREAVVWVHKKTGHGILDNGFWEKQDYYNQDYRNEFGAKIKEKVSPAEHLEIYKNINEKQFNTFASNLTGKTRFLEIGCSFGGILNKVASAGVAICHGIEPNENDVEFVRKSNKNSKIFNSTFEETKLPNEYYDMIVGIEVLEHTVSPYLFLKKCFDVLRRNGLLHIEVPNHNDVLLSAYGNRGYRNFYYHKAHIHYFTAASLDLLSHRCGFYGNISSFLMYPFFNHVWWYQNHKPQLSAITALARPLPTDEKSPERKAINRFYEKIENEYETLINSNMLGDCLIFQARKK